MTYSESANGVKISRKRADREIKRHGFSAYDAEWLEFANAQQWPINAEIVFEWLGY